MTEDSSDQLPPQNNEEFNDCSSSEILRTIFKNIEELYESQMLTPEQTRSYLPQDGDNQELTSDHQTDQVSKKGFIPC